MIRTSCLLATLLVMVTPFAQAEVKKEKEKNKNALILAHKDKLKLTASSSWPGYPVDRLIDGDNDTSWFSDKGDTTTQGMSPWVEVEFPEDVSIHRVTLLGNREPSFPKGFAILTGKLEFFDKDGKRLHAVEGEGVGDNRDFDFPLKKALQGVRKVRFTSLKDEGDKNGYDDVALAELQVE